MDWKALLDTATGFLGSGEPAALIGLIALDVILGAMRALREGDWDWGKLAQFYKTMVIPYLGGYLAFALVSQLVAPELLGDFGYLVGDAAVSLAWLALVGTLGNSILDNAKALAYAFKGT